VFLPLLCCHKKGNGRDGRRWQEIPRGQMKQKKKKPEPQTHEKNENQNELMRATYYYVQQYIIASCITLTWDLP
jgi:hypothetical protein